MPFIVSYENHNFHDFSWPSCSRRNRVTLKSCLPKVSEMSLQEKFLFSKEKKETPKMASWRWRHNVLAASVTGAKSQKVCVTENSPPKKHKEKNYNPRSSSGAWYSICGWCRQWTGCWEMELFLGINRGIKTKTVCEEKTKRRSFRISILSTTAIIILATVLVDNRTITYLNI